jgi:hypothetical protein
LKIAHLRGRDPANAVLEKVSGHQLVHAKSASFVILQKAHFAQAAYAKCHGALRKPEVMFKLPNRGTLFNGELEKDEDVCRSQRVQAHGTQHVTETR